MSFRRTYLLFFAATVLLVTPTSEAAATESSAFSASESAQATPQLALPPGPPPAVTSENDKPVPVVQPGPSDTEPALAAIEPEVSPVEPAPVATSSQLGRPFESRRTATEAIESEGVDYNAPASERTVIHWGRALAAMGTANYLVWQLNWGIEEDWAFVSRDELGDNLKNGFTWDGNRFPTNFFSHPYHGSAYFSVGRASGLTFWESSSVAFLGSLSWEYFAETEAPSTNDLIATTLGGIVLGEMLYRLSSEVLDDSKSGSERFFRELFAGLINPGRGVQRLFDGSAWAWGSPPKERNIVHGAFHVGVDRIRLAHDSAIRAYPARPLIALRINYGDWLPRRSSQTFDPFDAFDFYAALNLGNAEELGAQIYAQGLLLGYSSFIGEDEGEFADNNVFGLVQSFDFRSARVGEFGGVGIGPGNTIIVRYGREEHLRFGTDLQFLALGASSSPLDGDRNSGYNFLTGVTSGMDLRINMAAAGELGWRSKLYAGVVIDGEPGEEFIGHTRLWYEVDVVGGLGIGLSPNLVHRISQFDSVGRIASIQLETQIYARGHF